MFKRSVAVLVVASMLGMGQAWADNQMGYRLMPPAEASGLPRSGGTLGLNVGPADQITSQGLTFRLLRVNSVKAGSPGAQAGFRNGDDIIAVDGRVFPSVPAFASYVGSIPPGGQITLDYIPLGGGPQQAQRVTATLAGPPGAAAAPAAPAVDSAQPAPSQGLSTGAKVAIGVGAAALFGCYRLGCFSRFKKHPVVAPR